MHLSTLPDSAWFRSLEAGKQPPPLRNNRKRGQRNWLVWGNRRDYCPNRSCSSEGRGYSHPRAPEPPGWSPGKVGGVFLSWKRGLVPRGPGGTMLLCSVYLLGQSGVTSFLPTTVKVPGPIYIPGLELPWCSRVKNPPPNAGNASLIPGQGTKIPSAVGQPSPCAIPREPA